MSNLPYSFKNRTIPIPSALVFSYLSDFQIAYPTLVSNPSERKFYFHTHEVVIENGGTITHVAISSYEKDGSFANLYTLGSPPPNSTVIDYLIGEKRVYAVVFPSLTPLPLVVNHKITSMAVPTTANDVDTLFGLPSGTVTLFNMISSTEIEFNIPINYSLPTQFTNDTNLQEFEDLEGKQLAIENYQHLGCTSLTKANFQGATIVGRSGFEGCEGMVNGYTLPNVTRVKYLGFYGNLLLEDISLPSCTQLDGSSFAYCLVLNDLVFPLVEVIGVEAFSNSQGAGAGRMLSFPSLTTPALGAFNGWGGAGYTLEVPSALSSDPEILAVQANGTTVNFI